MIPPAQPSRRRHVVVNASALASASIWRIAISFVLFWYIARALGVEALGQYSLGMAYLNVAAIFSEAGLPNLLVRDLAQHPEYRRSRFRHALTLQSIFSLLTWLLLIGLVQILPLSDVVRQAIVLGAAYLPFYAITSVSLTMCKSSERMDLVFWLEVTGTTLMFAGSIVLIMLGYGVIGLFGVQIVAQIAVAGLGLILVVRNALLAGDQIPIPPGWIKLLRRALPFNGLALSEVLLQRMDVLILGVMVSDAVMGIYAAANNLVRVLTKLVQSVWWSLYPTLSRLRRTAIERYRRLIGLTLYLGFLTLLPAAAFSIIVAPELLHLVYGTDYLESVEIYRVIVCMVPLFFYEMYGITVLMVEHKPSRSLTIVLIHLVILAAAMPLLTMSLGVSGAAFATLLGSGAGVATALLFLRSTGLPLLPTHAAKLLAATLIAGLFTAFLPIPWVLQLLVGALVFGATAWLLRGIGPAEIAMVRRNLPDRWS